MHLWYSSAPAIVSTGAHSLAVGLYADKSGNAHAREQRSNSTVGIKAQTAAVAFHSASTASQQTSTVKKIDTKLNYSYYYGVGPQ